MAKFKTRVGTECTHLVAVDQVKSLYQEILANRKGNVTEAVQGLRTELSGLIQLDCPPPGPDEVTDEHRVLSDKDREVDPNHTSAHHWLQKQHGKAIWEEVDRLVAQAGLAGAK